MDYYRVTSRKSWRKVLIAEVYAPTPEAAIEATKKHFESENVEDLRAQKLFWPGVQVESL